MIKPELFSAFIKDAGLESVKLISLYSALSNKLQDGQNYRISLKTTFPFKRVESGILVFPTYKAFIENDKGKSAGIFSFRCEFSLYYSVKNIDGYADNLIRHFSDNNAKFNSWSYFRELLSNVTMRMEIGALIAPLLKPIPPEQPSHTSKK